jgi:hypothetical protein
MFLGDRQLRMVEVVEIATQSHQYSATDDMANARIDEQIITDGISMCA